MRKFCWQRWTLIFLLMARLVVGELGHAMPVAGMASSHEPTATQMAGDPACAEHESGKQSDGEHDCCKSGDCECPCLHVPCVAIDAAVMNSVAMTLLRIPHGVEVVSSLRPTRLFRPPA